MYAIIGRDDCIWCDRAKGLLEEKGLEYTYVLVEYNRWLVTLMQAAGYKTVPLIFSPDNKVIGGYTELEEIFGE
jgi:glutaredoxin